VRLGEEGALQGRYRHGGRTNSGEVMGKRGREESREEEKDPHPKESRAGGMEGGSR
jgi:hypothetical protein